MFFTPLRDLMAVRNKTPKILDTPEVSLGKTGGFWLLMGAQVSEQIADSLNLVALMAVFLAVFKGNSSLVSLYLFLPMVPPIVLLGPLAGIFVDRVSKRKMLIAAAVGRGVLVAGM